MSGFNFGDAYSRAGLKPTADLVRHRQEWFDSFRVDVSNGQVLDLTRLLFKLQPQSSDGFDWFRDSVAEFDPSFSLFENAREAALLAGCVLSSVIEEGNVEAGLAVVVVAAAHNRKPFVFPELVGIAEAKLDEMAVASRRRSTPDVSRIRQPAQTKSGIDPKQLAEDEDGSIVASYLQKVGDESRLAVASLAKQVVEVVKPIDGELADLREEVDMLWWFVGGYSRTLVRPFMELAPPLAATLAGYDLAELTRSAPGPIAARAILHRLLTAGRKGKPPIINLQSVVDAFSFEQLSRFEFSSAMGQVPDICPVLSALHKAAEIGESPSWIAPFKKVAQLPQGENTEFAFVDLSMQVYREALLVSQLEE